MAKEKFDRSKPHMNIGMIGHTTDVTGVATLPGGAEMVMPADNVNLEIELITPIAMEKGLRFAIREGGHTVGAGTVTEVMQ